MPRPTLTISSSERVMFRTIDEEGDAVVGCDTWSLSDPVPGMRIINTWEIYYHLWIVMSKAENGHYQIFQTTDRKTMNLVHDHAARIYNIYWIDSGHMIFCAADGWWATTNSGLTWTQFSSDAPVAKAAAVFDLGYEGPDHIGWFIIAYAEDHKIYSFEYPDGDTWAELFDTTSVWTGKWYPALAGSPVGFLAGAGNKLLRYEYGGSWYAVNEVDGVIKSIIVNNQSNMPIFLVEVEKIDSSESLLYWTYDMGDSLVLDMNRIGPVSSVQSVVPNTETEVQTTFVVLGRRTSAAVQKYKLITRNGR